VMYLLLAAEPLCGRCCSSHPPPRGPPTATLFPSTPLFRSGGERRGAGHARPDAVPGGRAAIEREPGGGPGQVRARLLLGRLELRSEEQTSEVQSHLNLVSRLLLEKQ